MIPTPYALTNYTLDNPPNNLTLLEKLFQDGYLLALGNIIYIIVSIYSGIKIDTLESSYREHIKELVTQALNEANTENPDRALSTHCRDTQTNITLHNVIIRKVFNEIYINITVTALNADSARQDQIRNKIISALAHQLDEKYICISISTITNESLHLHPQFSLSGELFSRNHIYNILTGVVSFFVIYGINIIKTPSPDHTPISFSSNAIGSGIIALSIYGIGWTSVFFQYYGLPNNLSQKRVAYNMSNNIINFGTIFGMIRLTVNLITSHLIIDALVDCITGAATLMLAQTLFNELIEPMIFLRVRPDLQRQTDAQTFKEKLKQWYITQMMWVKHSYYAIILAVRELYIAWIKPSALFWAAIAIGSMFGFLVMQDRAFPNNPKASFVASLPNNAVQQIAWLLAMDKTNNMIIRYLEGFIGIIGALIELYRAQKAKKVYKIYFSKEAAPSDSSDPRDADHSNARDRPLLIGMR